MIFAHRVFRLAEITCPIMRPLRKDYIMTNIVAPIVIAIVLIAIYLVAPKIAGYKTK